MEEIDINFEFEDNWFRYRTGAIIIEDGKTLLMYEEASGQYYSLGGGVHHGEKSEDSILREVLEETGVEFKIKRPLFLVESFYLGIFGSIKGKNCHALELYYLLKGPKKKKFKDHSINMDGEVERLKWLPIDELEKFDVHPPVLIPLIKNLPENFEIIINDER